MSGESFTPGAYSRPLWLAVSAVLVALLAAVAWQQLRPSDELARRAIREQSRLVYVPACRGTLCSSDGTPLNYTEPSYSIVIRPDLVRDPRDTRRATLAKLESAIAGLGAELGPEYYQLRPERDEILRHLERAPAMPLLLWEDVDAETRARWLSHRREYPSTDVILSWKRVYALPEVAPQLRGTTRAEAPRSSVSGTRYWNANAPDLVGVSGMEKALDYLLAGEGGDELLQTDVLSYRSNLLESRAAVRGDDCRLALNLPAQQLVEERFRSAGLSGAAIALEVESGRVVTMASLPATPLGTSPGQDGGMLNRALAGYYPPGSVMKPLYAIYALEKGIADPIETVDCKGFFPLTPSRKIGCSHVHGKIALSEAIAQSCNTYFCGLAMRFSRDQLDDFANFFGFGAKSGAEDLSEQENPGIGFSPSWVSSQRSSDRVWHPGDAANAGIGQGGWIVTPLQLALAYDYLLTGRLLSPRYFASDEAKIRREHDFPESARRLVLSGMRRCVTGGTGMSLNTPRASILAKTGTAENGSGKRPHAWVVAAAPAENPKYLVVVVVENGGGGGRVAGPIARDLLLGLLDGR